MTELTDGKPENAMEFARKSQDAVVLFLNTIGNQGQSLNIEANDAFLTAFVVLLAVTKQTFGMSQDALTGVIMQSLLKVESLEANPNFARNQGVGMEIKTNNLTPLWEKILKFFDIASYKEFEEVRTKHDNLANDYNSLVSDYRHAVYGIDTIYDYLMVESQNLRNREEFWRGMATKVYDMRPAYPHYTKRELERENYHGERFTQFNIQFAPINFIITRNEMNDSKLYNHLFACRMKECFEEASKHTAEYVAFKLSDNYLLPPNQATTPISKVNQ